MPRRPVALALIALALVVGCRERPTGDRVLLVGVDAATWDVARPLMAAGRMPTLQRLVREGWSATLESLEPTISPAIWTTIATGHRPSVHGVTGFLAPGPDGVEVPVTSNVRRRAALWTIASRHARTVNVVGWYVTWPVEPVNGVMVSDRFVDADRGALVGGPDSLSPEHPGVHPASLAPELERLFVRADRFIDPYERQFHRTFKAYPVDATRTAIAERLLRERPADLSLVYLWGIDPIQHHFWKYHDPDTWLGPPIPPDELELNRGKVAEYYEDTDAFLARLVAAAGPRTTILVVSDHGAGPLPTYDPTNPISGDHRVDGVVVVAGHRARRGEGDRASILDIAPTVLYLLGLAVGEDMEGRVLEEAIDPEFLAAHPRRSVATHETGRPETRPDAAVPTDADERIKERLRSLGYLR